MAEQAERAASRTGEAAPPKGDRNYRLPTLDEALDWIGMRVDGLEGRSLGRVAGIQVDAGDGKPRWVMLRLGPIVGCTALPFGHVAQGAGRLWAAYERDWVREAPRFKHDEALAAGEELELCAHWGIAQGSGRAGEVEPHEDDQVTAMPADPP